MGRHHPQLQSSQNPKNCRSGIHLCHLSRYVALHYIDYWHYWLNSFQLQVEQENDQLEVAEVVFEEEEEEVAEMPMGRNIKTEPETDLHSLMNSVEQGIRIPLQTVLNKVDPVSLTTISDNYVSVSDQSRHI